MNSCPPQKDGKNSCRLTRGDVSKSTCKVAFTLAEVLITLGIIGVVAALTLPTLIQNYQKQVYVNQLKKTYATLSEGFKQIVASEDCTTLKCSTGFDMRDDVDTVSFSKNETLREKIVKEFKLSNIVTGNSSNTSPYDYNVKSLHKDEIKYSDIFFSSNDLGMIGSTPQGSVITFSPSLIGFAIVVDINGLKQPNTVGRDIFIFVCIEDYNDSVIVTPLYSSLHFKWLGEDIDDEERITYVSKDCSTKTSSDDDLDGMTCAEKIIMDGWKMDY